MLRSIIVIFFLNGKIEFWCFFSFVSPKFRKSIQWSGEFKQLSGLCTEWAPKRKGLFPTLLVSWVHHSPHTALLCLISDGYNPPGTHCLVCGFSSPKGIVPLVYSGSPQGVQSQPLKYSTNYLLLIHRNFMVWIPHFLWDFIHFPHSSRPLLKYPLPSSECTLDMSPWQSLCLLHKSGPDIPSAPNFILLALCEQ